MAFFNLIIFRVNFGHRTSTTKVSGGHRRNTSLTTQGRRRIDWLWIIKKNHWRCFFYVGCSISKLQRCAYFELVSTGAKRKCERGFNWIENNFKSEDLAYFCSCTRPVLLSIIQNSFLKNLVWIFRHQVWSKNHISPVFLFRLQFSPVKFQDSSFQVLD